MKDTIRKTLTILLATGICFTSIPVYAMDDYENYIETSSDDYLEETLESTTPMYEQEAADETADVSVDDIFEDIVWETDVSEDAESVISTEAGYESEVETVAIVSEESNDFEESDDSVDASLVVELVEETPVSGEEAIAAMDEIPVSGEEAIAEPDAGEITTTEDVTLEPEEDDLELANIEEVYYAEAQVQTYVPGYDGISGHDLLTEYAASLLYPDDLTLQGVNGIDASTALEGLDLTIYNILKGYIQEVAAGNRSSTEFVISLEDLSLDGKSWNAQDLGVEAIVVDGTISKDATNALMEKELSYSLNAIVNALLHTMPYDLYWYDKTAGTSTKPLQFGASSDGSDWALTLNSDLTFCFAVASEYSAGGISGR